MPSPENYIERDILQRVAEGDENAFRQLFHHYKQKIYSVALKLTRSETSAEELLQDVFLIVWLRREHLVNVQDFDSYLFIITRNQSYKVLKTLAAQKKKAKEATDSLPVFHRETEQTISEHEYSTVIQKALNRLPPQQRQVYTLIKERGYSREQAAQEMQIHPETVKTHLAKALKTIRAFCMAHFQLLFFALMLGILYTV